MLLKEYRICMPLTTDEYKIGQLYMIAKHSHEQSSKGEGVEVVRNEPCEDPQHGKGQLTEKRIYLSSRLPSWIAALIPNIFYITEKAWNYYPYTITEYTCSFVPKFAIHIETRYENNNGSSDNVMSIGEEELVEREVDFVDIAYDELQPKHYKEEEDPTKYKSVKTSRGPLSDGWRDESAPIMCSYKVTRVRFEVWGMQTRVEQFTHKAVRDILLLGHRQAFTWMDEWHGMNMEDLRQYEARMQEETNQKVGAEMICVSDPSSPTTPTNTPTDPNPPSQLSDLYREGMAADTLFGEGVAADTLFGEGVAADTLFGEGVAADFT